MVGKWVKGSKKEPDEHGGKQPTKTVREWLPLAHDWPSAKLRANNASVDGRNMACRARNARDDSPRFYMGAEAATLRDCQRVCTMKPSACKAIEFTASPAKCELWPRVPEMVVPSPGSTCMVRVDRQVPVGTRRRR
jgi:hypothetical protein